MLANFHPKVCFLCEDGGGEEVQPAGLVRPVQAAPLQPAVALQHSHNHVRRASLLYLTIFYLFIQTTGNNKFLFEQKSEVICTDQEYQDEKKGQKGGGEEDDESSGEQM